MNDSIPTLPPLFPPAEIDGVTARELMANMLRIAALPPEEKAKMCAEIKKDIPYCSVEIDEMGVVNIWDCQIHVTTGNKKTIVGAGDVWGGDIRVKPDNSNAGKINTTNERG